MRESVAWLWLSRVLFAAAPNARALLQKYPDPREVYTHRADLHACGLVSETQQKRANEYSQADAEHAYSDALAAGVDILTPDCKEYPQELMEAEPPVLVLYVKGEKALLSAPVRIGVVGSRKPTAYGDEVTTQISGRLAELGAVVVSGLAYGVDAAASAAALNANMPTVAVVANGLDMYYPSQNRRLQQTIEKYGAVVSEYPLGMHCEKSYFIERNRIIAALSQALCVTEAAKSSGTFSTVRFALEYGKEVFAVPGSIFSPLSQGTNALLREGASCAVSAEDILAAFGLTFPSNENNIEQEPELPLSEAARQMGNVLQSTPRSLEELCVLSGFSPGKALAALSELEMQSLAKKAAGSKYAKNL